MGFSHDVFISYAHADVEFGRVVARLLEALHLRVWFDEEQMRGGDPVEERIKEALERSQHAIVIASEAWRGRPWTNWEAELLRQTVSDERRLVPILRVAVNLSHFGPYIAGLNPVDWLPEATDIDARFWLLWCALAPNLKPGPKNLWAAEGRKQLGWPPPPEPIPADWTSPGLKPVTPPRRVASRSLDGPDPVLLLDRNAQWSQLELIARSPNSQVAFVVGNKRQAHDVFLRRVKYCLPSVPARDIRPVEWRAAPPNSEAEYKSNLARALDCAPEQLVEGLKAAVRERNLVLVHRPVVEAMLHNEAFLQYYTRWLPELVGQVDPDPRPDDQIGAIKVIQAVAWVESHAVAKGAARLLRGVGLRGAWIDDATEQDEARRLLKRLQSESDTRCSIAVLEELSDISRGDIDAWLRVLPESPDRQRIVDIVLRGCRDSASIFEAIAGKFGDREEWKP